MNASIFHLLFVASSKTANLVFQTAKNDANTHYVTKTHYYSFFMERGMPQPTINNALQSLTEQWRL